MISLQRLDQAAASRNKRRQYDALLTVAAPHERIIFIVTIVLMLVFLAWALFGRIEHGVTIDGVLIKPGSRHDVVSAEPGYLIEFFSFPGNYVKAGDPIARQSVPELAREVEALRRRVDLLEREAGQTGENSALLSSLRTTLLEMEARRDVREIIVTHIEGEIMTLQSEPGKFVPAGSSVARIRSGPDAKAGLTHAVLRLPPGIAQRIQPGMQATVDVAIPGRGTQILQGAVDSVTAGPLPKWLATMEPVTEDALYRVHVVLHQEPGHPVSNGAACRVRIVLGEDSPTALLVPDSREI